MDEAHKATDAAIARLEKKIKSVYSEAQRDLQAKMDDFTERFRVKDEKHRQELAEGKITEDDYRGWLAGQVFQGKQWQAKIDQMTAALASANVEAQAIINGSVYGVFANNANWQAYKLEHDCGLNLSFGVYDEAAVARLLKDQPNLLPKKKVDIVADRKWSTTKISQQITQGIIQGEKLSQVATRLQNVTGMERNFALTNARTAMTGAQNAGRQVRLDEAEGMGLKVKKEWIATLDMHTRISHRALDGQKVDTDKPFVFSGLKIRYPGDPRALPALVYNCRCTMAGDLEEFPDENAQRRDNINGKIIKDMTYAEWRAAKDGKPVKKPAEVVEKPKKIAQLNGIREDLGDEFVDHMQEMLEKVQNQNYRDVYYKYGDRLGVIDHNMKRGAHYDAWTQVSGEGKVGGIRFNSETDAKGDSCHRPYQTAFHEFGHNIDRLATGGDKWISLEYKDGALGKAIKSDYKALIDARMKARKEELLARSRKTVSEYSTLELRQALLDIATATGKDFSGLLHDLRHGAVTREQVIEKYRKDLEKNEYSSIKYLLPTRKVAVQKFIEEIKDEKRSLYEVGSVSDILEGCTGISYPLGVGHGANYHKKTGYTPLEFFAETCDGYIASPESYAQMKRFFPTAVGIVEEIMEMLAK